MTLIPMLSAALLSPTRQPVPSGGSSLMRGSYDPGARHRPLAAVLAVGLPAALIVALALSPMIVEPVTKREPTTVTSIELEKPLPPPPEVRDDPLPAPPTQMTIVKPRIDTQPLSEVVIKQEPLQPYVPTLIVESGPPTGFVSPLPKPKFVGAGVDGRYAHLLQPDYPATEQRGGIEGLVTVRVLIGTDGRVKAVEQLSSASPGFFEATKRRALAKWRFKPATRGGVAEESWKVMTVRFEIKGA